MTHWNKVNNTSNLILYSPFKGRGALGKFHVPSHNALTTLVWNIEIKLMQTRN